MFGRFKRRRGITKLLDYIQRNYEQRKAGSVLYRYAPLASLGLYSAYVIAALYIYSSRNLIDSVPQISNHDNIGYAEPGAGVQYSLRHLLNAQDVNDTSSEGLPWEQCEFETSSPYKIGWVIHHLWWIFFFFIGLAVVCDDFFVPALEIISDKLQLSEDVAGATFMAAGSSAPELFTSLMGVAQESDVGVGAIVGSAVFNILVIISLTGALAGQVLQLDWRPLVRDMTFYAVSILAFLGVAFDGKITWYEALLLLLLYVLYIGAMVLNPRLMRLMNKPCCCPAATAVDVETAMEASDDPVLLYNNNEEDLSLPPPSALHARRVSFQKSSFSGGHARRISIHNHLHSPRRVNSLGLSLPDGSQAHSPAKRDSGFSDSRESEGNRHSAGSTQVSFPEIRKKSLILPPVTKSQEVISDQSGSVENEDKKMETVVEVGNTSGQRTENGTTNYKRRSNDSCVAIEEVEEEDELVICSASCCPRIKSTPPVVPEERSCWTMFIFCLKWWLYVIAFPFYFMCTFTIPDCSKDHNRKWFMATFCLSILWILALSFAMVTMVTRTGCIIGLDEFVMGLVIIAIGTSVPDCLSSILVARDGFGDMAVSNAIGSNVFDIDLGLGFPFLLRILIQAGSPVILLDETELALRADGKIPIIPHVKFALILLGLLVIIFLLFLVSKFRLNRLISVSFIILYVLFIAYALIQQIVCKNLC